jgi:hypothetical protein
MTRAFAPMPKPARISLRVRPPGRPWFQGAVGELDAPSYAWGVGQVLERFLHRVTDVQPQAIRGGGGSQPADDQSSPCNHSQT